MAAFGLTLDDVAADQVVDIWPDCWEAVGLFNEFLTQWRMGSGGPVGLDYGPIFTRMERLHLTDEGWEQMFSDLRTLEGEALKTMRKTNG